MEQGAPDPSQDNLRPQGSDPGAEARANLILPLLRIPEDGDGLGNIPYITCHLPRKGSLEAEVPEGLLSLSGQASH